MGRHLVVSSTKFEIQPVLDQLDMASLFDSEAGACWRKGTQGADVLISGVGQMQTSYHLGAVLAKEAYDTVLNLGIAGSFRDDLEARSLVCVVQEELADLGAEDSDRYLDLFEMGLLDPNLRPFSNGALRVALPSLSSLESLATVNSITVNRVLSSSESIDRVVKKYAPDIVNMEGAAIFYACLRTDTPCISIRAISDRVGPRDKSKWDIPGAIKALCTKAHEVIAELLE